jgi:hypothetical protein
MKKFVALMILAFAVPAFAQDLEDEIEKPPAAEKKKDVKKEKADMSKSDAGDTYNFYFQKGSGPGSVEQGGGAQKAKPDGTSAAEQKNEEDYSKFEGHLGLVVMPASSGSGLSLGGQFNFSRQFGLQVHLLSLNGEADGGKSSSFSASGTEDKETKISSVGGSVAAVYTPVTFNERKMPVRLGLLGGVMVLSTTREEKTSTFSAMGSNDSTNTTKSAKTLPFAGVSASARLAKQFGLSGYGKIASVSDYSQIGISAAWFF